MLEPLAAPFSGLHDMLVAGPALTTKGGDQDFPLPRRAIPRGPKSSPPCPSPLRFALGVFRSLALPFDHHCNTKKGTRQ
jgi:hypothetical protein